MILFAGNIGFASKGFWFDLFTSTRDCVETFTSTGDGVKLFGSTGDCLGRRFSDQNVRLKFPACLIWQIN